MPQTKNKEVNSANKMTDNKINASFSDNALKMMKKRYLFTKPNGLQETPAEMFHRIAKAIASVDKKYGKNEEFIAKTEADFFEVMATKEYTPAGRTLTNAGTGTALIANCIVLPVMDSMESIFSTLKDASLLQQAGSGLGFDFSHLRPALFSTKKSRGVSSGPVSFLKVYNEAFSVIKQQGRHGANMAMMEVTHPDILDFIRSKEVEGSIRNFNISIKVTDEFMKAVTERPNEEWLTTWNGQKMRPRRVIRTNDGNVVAVEEISITAKKLFDELVHSAWSNGEPGIVFIDEVNRTNPLPGLGAIDCSNPCGEQFLHHYDNCNLGSINLAVFVKEKKDRKGNIAPYVDFERLKFVTKTSVRLMDNVIDLFDFPVKQVTELANKNRRIGLGIMGFADLLYQMNIPYNSEEGREVAEKVMKTIQDASHKASMDIAKEKGEFENTPLSIYGKKKIKMRNAALTTVAPTGSISMMYDCSSGIEPNFALAYIKQDKDGHKYHYFNRYFDAQLKKQKFSSEKIQEIRENVINTGSVQSLKDLPEEFLKTFVVSMDISASDHMEMQAAFQRNVDNSISKTINFPNSATKEDVFNGYVTAWKLKCKSATVYRDGSRNVQILNIGDEKGIKSTAEMPEELKQKSQEAPLNLNLKMDEHRLSPKSRPGMMHGKTYKIKTGYGNLYVTINDDETGVPFEIFATIGKSGGFFQEQSEAICRMISLSLRSGVKVEQVIEQLKGIRGPMPVLTENGTVLSLPDAIGQLIESHVKAQAEIKTTEPKKEKMENSFAKAISVSSNEDIMAGIAKKAIADFGMMPGCPDCGNALTFGEGCLSCKSCGYSRCV